MELDIGSKVKEIEFVDKGPLMGMCFNEGLVDKSSQIMELQDKGCWEEVSILYHEHEQYLKNSKKLNNTIKVNGILYDL